jgi:hypothetical protein
MRRYCGEHPKIGLLGNTARRHARRSPSSTKGVVLAQKKTGILKIEDIVGHIMSTTFSKREGDDWVFYNKVVTYTPLKAPYVKEAIVKSHKLIGFFKGGD